MEMELDVTKTPATATAEKIHAFVLECLSSQNDREVA